MTINEKTYRWCVRAFSFLYNRLGITITLHDPANLAQDGQIFLFNHFARFETVIPQYLLFQETESYCRSVAASEFFKGNETAANFLRSIGAVPNDLDGLLPFLAAEVLRGRKIIVFPEGGLVKNRDVLEGGDYSVFSVTAQERRKHHKGAAAIATMLEIFKKRILTTYEDGEEDRLERWRAALGLPDIDALLQAARKPTIVVPSNITFFPIRVSDNILRKSVELFARGLRSQFKEELVIEGNILLEKTDMDVRFCSALKPKGFDSWWERLLLNRIFENIHSLENLFSIRHDSEKWAERLFSFLLQRRIRALRDLATREMYNGVTINLSHLASTLILMILESGTNHVSRDRLHNALYLAIKNVQRDETLHLHNGIVNPEAYFGLRRGQSPDLEQFLELIKSKGLITEEAGDYWLQPKLSQDHAHHEIRLENMVEVYANEVAPSTVARSSIARAWEESAALMPEVQARLRFDDELRVYEWCRRSYSQPRHLAINQQETAYADSRPYLLVPEDRKSTGIVLVHGFLASPAELSAFGQHLAESGYPVIGVRLSGHGTSPWDLRDRSWNDWLDSVRRGFEIMAAFVDRICLVGFSTGGTLALHLAAEQPLKLAGVVTVAAPLRFQNRNLIYVPMIHGANLLAEWASSLEGVKPFVTNDSENPDVNYRNIPVRGLYELRRVVDDLKKRLPEITCPVAIIQGSDDPVVLPKSADMIADGLSSAEKTVHYVPAERHGILREDIGETQEIIRAFLASLEHRKAVLPTEMLMEMDHANTASR